MHPADRHEPIHALILAAGSSSRLRPYIKQLCIHTPSGKTLISRCIDETVRVDSIQSITVILGAHADKVRHAIASTDHQGFEIIYHPDHASGMGSSIAFGIQHLQHKYAQQQGCFSVCLILVDQIEVDSTLLEALIQTHSGTTSAITATRYSNESFGPPVLFGSSHLAHLSSLSGEKGAKVILQRNIENLHLYTHPGFCGSDLDTLDDLEKNGILPSLQLRT